MARVPARRSTSREIGRFLERYPNSEYLGEVERYRSRIGVENTGDSDGGVSGTTSDRKEIK